MAVLNIYGTRAIILLFCYHQDIESESREIEMIISQPVLPHKKIPKALLENDIHTLQDWRILLWQFFIFMELEPFPTIL